MSDHTPGLPVSRTTNLLPGQESELLHLEHDLSGTATKVFRLLEVEFSEDLKLAQDAFQRAVSQLKQP